MDNQKLYFTSRLHNLFYRPPLSHLSPSSAESLKKCDITVSYLTLTGGVAETSKIPILCWPSLLSDVARFIQMMEDLPSPTKNNTQFHLQPFLDGLNLDAKIGPSLIMRLGLLTDNQFRQYFFAEDVQNTNANYLQRRSGEMINPDTVSSHHLD